MTDRRSLSRRKLLWAVATVGAAASTGSGSAALLNDSQQVSSEMTSGTLDLSAQWGNADSTKQANIETETRSDTGRQKRVTLTVGDNPAYVWVRIPCEETEQTKTWGKGWSKDWGSWKDKYGGKSRKDRTDQNPSFLNDGESGSDDHTRDDDILVRIGLDDGDGVRWLTGTSGSTYVSPTEAYEQFVGGVYLGQLAPGSDSTWEFVVEWKLDGVLMEAAKIDFDFTFYATQSRHTDPEMAEPDWECGQTTGSGISWVAFCASKAFDKDAISLSLSDDERTVSLSGVPDVVNTVAIKHGTNLTVVTYTDQDSITAGSDGDSHDQVASGFSGTDRSNSDPCPTSDTFGCKYEFPGGWQPCSWEQIGDTEEHESVGDWGGDDR